MTGIDYKLQNIMLRDAAGDITGPKVAVDFIQQMAKMMQFNVNGVARLSFHGGDSYMHQIVRGKGNKQAKHSAYDTYLVQQLFKDDSWAVYMMIHEGVTGIPAGMMFSTDYEPTFSAAYEKQGYFMILKKEQFKDIVLEAVKKEIFRVPLPASQNN